MTDTDCPHCHQKSSTAEFCSECGHGLKADAAGGTDASPDSPFADDSTVCPDCSDVRVGAVCETCGYNFITHRSYEPKSSPVCSVPVDTAATDAVDAPPVSAPDAAPAPVDAAPPADADTGTGQDAETQPADDAPVAPVPLVQSAAVSRWRLRGTVDLSMHQDGDPMPPDMLSRVWDIDYDQTLIGRRSDKDGIHPEIPLVDGGASKRHARIVREANGSLCLVDLGSTNGTLLNGAAVSPNALVPLSEGDVIRIGFWTQMRLEKV